MADSQTLEQRYKTGLTIGLLTFIFLLVLFLRHDFWQWDTPGHLLFGFLPVGLWWQAGVTLLATLMMALMVLLAWPSHLEQASTTKP
jgi:hypothetical protein